MCLRLGNNKKKFKDVKEAITFHKKIATEDIIVYKNLDNYNGRLFSIYKNMEYERNTWYYQTGNKFTYVFRKFEWETIFNVSQGLHSYANENIGLYGQSYKAIIPKGSEYFTNGKEYCSDNLIIL